MRYSEARLGRIFTLRLEDGEIVHKKIEQFAAEQHIVSASLIILGGADDGSQLIVGPREDRGLPLDPMKYVLQNVHEIAGVGTLFPDEHGRPLLHMHMACGRGQQTVTGCIREGITVWHVMEVIVYELVDSTARRLAEPPLGLNLLAP